MNGIKEKIGDGSEELVTVNIGKIKQLKILDAWNFKEEIPRHVFVEVEPNIMAICDHIVQSKRVRESFFPCYVRDVLEKM